ncbi:MAG: YadA-like family protein, partial [Haemophilus seminalis]
ANNIANVANKVATAQDVANAINKSGFTLSTSANGGEKISGTPEMINPGKKVEMVAGKNMTVKQESNGKVTYATASNVTFDSVQFGDKGPKITNKAGNINVSSPDGKTPTKVTGVAPGEISATSKDAINGSQLYAVAAGIGHKLGDLDNKINKVGKRGDAGTASALAAANIPQAYTPGKSLVGIAAGSYQGQNGLAVGMSRISDNGKIIIRLSGTANSQGKTGVAAGVGYQW